MRDAKDGVDELGIRRTQIELQQRRFHRVERFEALLEESVMELREVERHAALSVNALRPSSFVVARKFSDIPVSWTSRPASRRSRTNATRTCRPAVSQRFTAVRSTVTHARSVSSFTSSLCNPGACSMVQSAPRTTGLDARALLAALARAGATEDVRTSVARGRRAAGLEAAEPRALGFLRRAFISTRSFRHCSRPYARPIGGSRNALSRHRQNSEKGLGCLE